MWTEIAMQLRTEIVLYVIVRLPIFDRSSCWPDITGRQDELCLLSIFLFLVTLDSSWVDITQHHPIWRPIKSRPVLTADMSRDDGPSCQVMSAHVGERFHVCVRVQRWLFIEICNLSLCITADYTPHSRRLSMRCPRHSKSESTQSHRYLMYIKPNVCVCVCVSCSMCTATLFSGSARNLACGIRAYTLQMVMGVSERRSSLRAHASSDATDRAP